MKLYLSSLGIPDEKAFLRLCSPRDPRRVVIIPTAWNAYPAEKSAPYMQSISQTFRGMDFTHAFVDLADYKGKPDELSLALSGATVLWVMGGNTFYLNYWMRESGFDTLLPDLLQQGMVYGGESAGAAVAGKTLHGIEVLDNPQDAPEIIWNGLSLVDYSILPHWGNTAYAGRLEQAYEEMRLFTPVKILTDEQYIVVN